MDLHLEVRYVIYLVRADPKLTETPSKQTRKNQKKTAAETAKKQKSSKIGVSATVGKRVRKLV